jgi:hypothetical protein
MEARVVPAAGAGFEFDFIFCRLDIAAILL